MINANQNSFVMVKQHLSATGSFAAALLASLPVVPLIATVLSVISYVTAWPELKVPGWFAGLGPFAPPLVGIIPTLLLWLLLAFFFQRFTAVDTVNPHGCNSLLQHLSNLNCYIDAWYPKEEQSTYKLVKEAIKQQPGRPNIFSWLLSSRGNNKASNGNKQPDTTKQPDATNTTPPTNNPPASQPSAASTTSPANQQPLQNGTDMLDYKRQVVQYRNDIYLSLIQSSTAWIEGAGYIYLWELMNRAEEALINVMPRANITCEAIKDEMRLNGSKIQNSEEWTNKLRLAVKNLDALVPASSATDYLKPASPSPIILPPNPQAVSGQTNQSQTPAASSAPATPPQNTPTSPAQSTGSSAQPLPTCKISLQEAQARAILREVRETIDKFDANNWIKLIKSRNYLVWVINFVGLAVFAFVEFAIIIKISPTHLLVAAIFYAVGALAGLINRLPQEGTNNNVADDYKLGFVRLLITPQLAGITAVIGVLLFSHAAKLNDVFTFTNMTTTLIIAAIFGLSPNLLVNQLKSQADQYTGNLTSTQSTTGK